MMRKRLTPNTIWNPAFLPKWFLSKAQMMVQTRKTCKLKLDVEDMVKSHSLYACSESGSETAVENESDVKRD